MGQVWKESGMQMDLGLGHIIGFVGILISIALVWAHIRMRVSDIYEHTRVLPQIEVKVTEIAADLKGLTNLALAELLRGGRTETKGTGNPEITEQGEANIPKIVKEKIQTLLNQNPKISGVKLILATVEDLDACQLADILGNNEISIKHFLALIEAYGNKIRSEVQAKE